MRGDRLKLLLLAARSLAGRRFWVVALFPVIWSLGAALMFPLQMATEAYEPFDAQGALIGLPLAVLGLLLGVRIIAGEIDRRTLEIAYTVPGGAHRIWLAKFVAAALLLLAAELPLAGVTWLLLTSFPATALYGAYQAGLVYLSLGLAFGALTRSETTGAMVGAFVLIVNGVLTGFGTNQLRFSPFWNPLAPQLERFSPSDLLAWTVQNRIGFLLLTGALVALSIARAERREKLLS